MALRALTVSKRRLSATMIGASPDGVLEPIDLATTKQVLRFTSSSEDELIEGWTEAARQWFEGETGRQVMAALWELTLDAFPVGGVIELPSPPLLELVSVVAGGATVDASSYTVTPQAVGSPAVVTDPFAPRATIALNASASWPTVTTQAGAVVVTFWAGYSATPADIPQIVKTCLQGITQHFHARSTDEFPMTVRTMLRAFSWSCPTQVAMERTV